MYTSMHSAVCFVCLVCFFVGTLAVCVCVRTSKIVASLEANAADLGERIKRCRLDALRENRQGQKRAALAHVRRMKHLQTARDKRLSSLYTLETALDQVGLLFFRQVRQTVFACVPREARVRRVGRGWTGFVSTQPHEQLKGTATLVGLGGTVITTAGQVADALSGEVNQT